MHRYSASWISSGAGTTARPVGGLVSVAAQGFHVLKASIFNTTSTAATFRLARLTATVGAGTDREEIAWHSSDGPAASITAKDSWSADATVTAGGIETIQLGAAVGSGAIFTFQWPGVYIPAGTVNGIGWVPISTGQICAVGFEWEE